MDKKKITVFIYLPGETVGVPAGIFTHYPEAGIGSFAYGRRYQERDHALPVDPVALPMGVRPREVSTNGGIYGSFRDGSPDFWGRLVIAAEAKAPPEAFSDIDFLMAANATRVGNLDFRSTPEDPEPTLAAPHFNQLSELVDAAEKIEAGKETESHLLQLLRQGSSVGGARPKCTVEWEDALWIAKFPAKDDTLNIPRIEYATLTLAQQCGIRIPEVHVVSIGGNDVFLTNRFDRKKSDSGWLRKGFLSALSLMQWDESDRLRWDYAAISDTMRRHATVADIEELFRRMVFNILVRNMDDHPRNHGFLVDEEKVSIAPAYDIVPSPARYGIDTNFRLAMSVGEEGREATLENALSRAGRFGYSAADARTVVEEMLKIIGNWRSHYEACGIPGHEIDLLAPSFFVAKK
ncbi:MAG: HipA domain-containing protein [Deltaproteobacteria bacterium]|nr:HipA domain-containing protein [Deltaproteobacteria bacterium]